MLVNVTDCEIENRETDNEAIVVGKEGTAFRRTKSLYNPEN